MTRSHPGCTGLLVTNLGTPDAPTPAAVRKYLREFLWDPRVVELPRVLWWALLNGFILPVRPRRVAPKYQEIWTPEGSPLLAISRRQVARLGEILSARFPGAFKIALGMRYGSPSIPESMEALRAASVRRLLVLPLYPQYSATTTASTFDAVAAVLQGWRLVPELHFINSYHDHPGYLDAVAASIRDALSAHGGCDRLLFSFHGIPRRYVEAGDPYADECHASARLIAASLGLKDQQWTVSFQSRVGREEWLRPYTDHLLREWGRAGVASVAVACPGFSADCLETLEEIALQNRDMFQAAGGGDYRYIPCLNDRRDHMDALAQIVCERAGY